MNHKYHGWPDIQIKTFAGPHKAVEKEVNQFLMEHNQSIIDIQWNAPSAYGSQVMVAYVVEYEPSEEDDVDFADCEK